MYGGSYPFVQTADVCEADTYLTEASSHYSERGLAQSRLWPVDTLCITIAAHIGRTALLGIEACFPDSIVGFLPASDLVSVRFVEYFLRSAQQRIEEAAPATAQKNINLEILRRVVLPLPSLIEQLEIVRVIAVSLEGVREISEGISMGARQSTAQRKNILQAAFSGQLVPQDPNDEPASVLLARIRAERESRLAKARKPRATKESA